ncbi:hypothetical protein ATO6_05790 [Oceanicola sp. 22II-s10i]|nr:hypothetical protein ATO6_05790 [Oceanicola sp. 22II-s10i]
MPRVDHAMLWIDAPAPRVFNAWTDPRALIEWLPPEGMRGRVARFDPQPGGSFRLTLTRTDGPAADAKSTDDSDVVEGRFVVVEPHARISVEVDFDSERPEFQGTMTMEWTFTTDKMGTTVRIAAWNVPPGIDPRDHEAGLASSLTNLSRYLAKEAA